MSNMSLEQVKQFITNSDEMSSISKMYGDDSDDLFEWYEIHLLISDELNITATIIVDYERMVALNLKYDRTESVKTGQLIEDPTPNDRAA